jgi:hypothetical protein
LPENPIAAGKTTGGGVFFIPVLITTINMEDNLITLAIHTFEKAQILKTILETEGIEVYIHNVNQIQPVISAGVRVRIKESDLPHALRIIEDNTWLEKTQEEITARQPHEK